MYFEDIIIAQDFIEEWTEAPLNVRESVDRKINQLALEHVFRPSANLHRVRWSDEELWICHLNNGAGAWRMIVKVENCTLYLTHLMCHSDMMHKYTER